MTDRDLDAFFDAHAEARKAVDFHMRLKPDAPLHLVAIREGAAPSARTFSCEEVDAATKWIAASQGQAGVYFHVADLKADVRNVKAKKADVASTSLLHVDIDSPDALELLRNFKPAAMVTVFSGGGAHAYWSIRKRMTNLALVERLNQALAQALDRLSWRRGHAYQPSVWPNSASRRRPARPTTRRQVRLHPCA